MKAQLQEVVNRVSHFLGLDSPSSGLIVGISQGRIGHVALLVHPRLMVMGINIAVKKGRWDTYFCRSRSDISVSKEEIQKPEEEGHRVPMKAELPASDPPLLVIHLSCLVLNKWGMKDSQFNHAVNAEAHTCKRAIQKKGFA